MMVKLITLIALCFMLMGVSTCSIVKYGPPPFEDCTVISEWSEQKQTDIATCFCIDQTITQNNFHLIVEHTEAVYGQHPQKNMVLDYLNTNSEAIIKSKEYELPIHYCRGYTGIGPKDRTDLTIWAETNRMKRIECELELETKK